MREKIVITHKKNVGIIIKGKMTDDHLSQAVADLRAAEFNRRKSPKKKHGVIKTIRKFFRCLYKAMQPTPRAQRVTCKMPLMLEARYERG